MTANVSLNYSQSIKIKIEPSDGGTIVPSTHCPTLLKFIYSEKATKILRNLHLTFDHSTHSQKLGEDFTKFCGLLRIYAGPPLLLRPCLNFGLQLNLSQPGGQIIPTTVLRAPPDLQTLQAGVCCGPCNPSKWEADI